MLTAASPILLAALLPLPATPAQQWNPSSMITGWEVEDGVVSFPLSSLVGLTEEAADGLSGDARQVAYSFLLTASIWQAQLATAPAAFGLSYTSGGTVTGSAFAGKLRHRYTMTAITLPGTNLVTEE